MDRKFNTISYDLVRKADAALILFLSKVFHYVKTETVNIIWSKRKINYSKSSVRAKTQKD